jgi:hypothetical protein
MSRSFRVGDHVQLTSQPPGRTRLQVGQRGEIVAEGLAWGWLTVIFARRLRPYLVRPQHLALIAPAPAGGLTGNHRGDVAQPCGGAADGGPVHPMSAAQSRGAEPVRRQAGSPAPRRSDRRGGR